MYHFFLFQKSYFKHNFKIRCLYPRRGILSGRQGRQNPFHQAFRLGGPEARQPSTPCHLQVNNQLITNQLIFGITYNLEQFLNFHKSLKYYANY